MKEKLQSLLFPGFTVFAWGHTDNVVEYDLKVVRVIVSALQCDVGDGLTGGNQKILCFADAAECDVLHW